MLCDLFTWFFQKSIHLYRTLVDRVCSWCKSWCCTNLVQNSYYFLIHHVNSFWFQIWYFLSVSVIGFFLLKALSPSSSDSIPRDLDLFFTAVSATTVSSMSTVEMEVFSNSQLIVLTVLMLVGGEVFTSMVGLRFKGSKLIRRSWKSSKSCRVTNVVESSMIKGVEEKDEQQYHTGSVVVVVVVDEKPKLMNKEDLQYRSIKLLGQIVSAYFLVVQACGIIMVVSYISISTSATNVLKKKGLVLSTFSIFTVVSTFASCGFVPTNENMIIFGQNSGLLLILIPQILLGNTLFPPCLRFLIWGYGKLSRRDDETEYLVRHTEEYLHLLPRRHCLWLVITVFGFIGVQFVVFCLAQWNSAVLSGLSVYEKLVGVLFQCVNSRHTGETIVDLSAVAPVVLVLFVAMMYFPPYTALIPIHENSESNKKDGDHTSKTKLLDNLLFSQLSYLLIFIMLICVTERLSLQKDPLNFNLLNIIVEVISAYGNVGFSTGYSCARRLTPHHGFCVDKSYGFSGKWTDQGKITLIFVMLFGRLKKFNMRGGKAWNLL